MIKSFVGCVFVALFILHYWPNFFLGLGWAVAHIYWYLHVVYDYVNVLTLYNNRMWVIMTAEAGEKCEWKLTVNVFYSMEANPLPSKIKQRQKKQID